VGGTGEQNGEDDWPRVRREARILSESNYRAGRAVVINQIPRRDDATKTNPVSRPGESISETRVSRVYNIIVDRRAHGRECERASVHARGVRSLSRYPLTRLALASTWRARSSNLAPYPTNCASFLSLSLFLFLSLCFFASHPRRWRTVTDRRINRGRHSAHLAALLLTVYLRLHRRRASRFSAGSRARDGSAERIKCNSEEDALDPEETGLTDPVELNDSRRSLLDCSAITRGWLQYRVPANHYLTNI